jgi:DNA-binding transcriptional regulator GbsR (MarR family)
MTDHTDVLRFVEQFALILTDSGMQRMPARVFAYVLADDADRYTAAELAAGLQVSPAAISGAVGYLVRAGLLGRERVPGSRADHFVIPEEDVWGAISAQRIRSLRRYETVLTDGLALLDQDSAGGRRVRETLEYFRFVQADLPTFLERWSEHRKQALDGD